jgi:HSP20 family protein
MTLLVKRPKHSLFSFGHDFEKMVDRFFEGAPQGLETDFRPKVNVQDNDKQITIEAEVPGVEEKEIEVEVKEDTLVLRGERKNSIERKEGEYTYFESSYGKFSRSFRLPESAVGEKAEAKYNKGVLTITIPKEEKIEQVKKIPVQ